MDSLKQHIESLYSSKNRSQEWQDERPILVPLIEEIQKDISYNYSVSGEDVFMGSTGLVWTVMDNKLKVVRALKMPRPRPGKIKKIVKVIRDEADKLKSLNHQNVIRVFSHGEVSLNGDSYPYYIMEFLPGIQDFRLFLTEEIVSFEKLVDMLASIVDGVAHLHQNNIIHCDLKPENLLVPKNSPPLVADLGYAKYFTYVETSDGDRLTQVTFTPRYAHPELRQLIVSASDSGANVSEIMRKELKIAFDLYALGRSVLELMRLFLHRQLPEELPKGEVPADDQSFEFLKIPLERTLKGLDPYKWRYLWIMAARMLDGKNEASNCVPGLTPAVMQQLRYANVAEVQLDFLKITNRYSIPDHVPELNIYEKGVLQIASTSPVVFSERVRSLYNHPHLHRLAKLSQLGVSYPKSVKAERGSQVLFLQ